MKMTPKMLPWMRQFEAFAGRLLVEHKIPGISVGVAHEGEIVYAQGFGFRDREAGLPCTPETVHGIGSATKSFTAVAIMQLHERGQLNLDDLVIKHIPEFRTPDPEHTNRVTIHHLLTHSAGLPPLPTLFSALKTSLLADPAVTNGPMAAQLGQIPLIETEAELLGYLAAVPYELLGAPGTKFSYSNEGYALLGVIIARVSGLSYEAYMVENVLKPAGMHQSTFSLETLHTYDEVTMLYAPGTDLETIERQPGWWQAPTMLSAGFLRSTVPDMLRYTEIYRNGGLVGGNRLLTATSVKVMTAPHIRCGPNQWYGYGLMVTPDYHGVTLVEHGGAIKGVSAIFSCVPECALTAVALVNASAMPSSRLVLGAVNAYLGLDLKTRRLELPDQPCPAEALSGYAGDYISGEGATVKVSTEAEKLVLEMQGKKATARPVGPDLFCFELRGDEIPVTFLRDASGKVSHASLGRRIIKRSA